MAKSLPYPKISLPLIFMPFKIPCSFHAWPNCSLPVQRRHKLNNVVHFLHASQARTASDDVGLTLCSSVSFTNPTNVVLSSSTQAGSLVQELSNLDDHPNCPEYRVPDHTYSQRLWFHWFWVCFVFLFLSFSGASADDGQAWKCISRCISLPLEKATSSLSHC